MPPGFCPDECPVIIRSGLHQKQWIVFSFRYASGSHTGKRESQGLYMPGAQVKKTRNVKPIHRNSSPYSLSISLLPDPARSVTRLL